MMRRPASRGRVRRRPVPIMVLVVAALAALLLPSVRPDPVDAQATLNSQATLTVLTSPVEVQRASGNRETASSGFTLVVGDRVFTGSGGTAKLTFFQGTEVDIAPETELMVQEMTQRQSGASTVSFGQAVGSTVAKVASLFNPASRVQVSTQSAVAVIRGTEVETTVTKEKVQVFRSNTGSFDVIAGGQTQRVKDGEVTVVPPPPPPPASAPTTRDSQSVGNAQAADPSGTDRAPLPPVPVAEIGKLFEKVGEITAKDGPRVVATPPVAARDLIDVAQGKPVVLRPLGELAPTPIPTSPPATPPPPPPGATPSPVKQPTPVPQATTVPQQSSGGGSTAQAPTPACPTEINTATPTSSQTRFKGNLQDASGNPVAGACVTAANYTGEMKASAISDASGTFRIIVSSPPTSGASGTFLLTADVDGYTQSAVPSRLAVLGQTSLDNVTVLADDVTIVGAITSGASTTSVGGVIASLVVEVPTPTGYTGRTAQVRVAQATSGASGYQLRAASGGSSGYTYLLAEQSNASPYAYRASAAPVPSLSTGSTASAALVLPTLEVSSTLTCDQHGAPCSITVSGAGWSANSNDYVGIYAKDAAGIIRSFGSVPVSNGTLSPQKFVAQEPTWPTGQYTVFASQGTGASQRYVALSEPFAVSAGTMASSCPVTDGSATPSGSQVKVTGSVTHASAGVPNACVKVGLANGPESSAGYAKTDANGNYAVLLTGASGDYYVVVTKPGYTPLSVPYVTLTAGQQASASPISLGLNDATITGRVTTGGTTTGVSAGTKVGILVSVTGGNSPSGIPFVATATPGSDGSYSFGLVHAASGTYRLSVYQVNADGYSMRGYEGPAGDVNGTVTRNVTLPTFSVSGSCTAGATTCPITASGAGWFAGSPVSVRATSSTDTIEFSSLTPGSNGSFSSQALQGSIYGQAPVPAGGYSVNADQTGPGGESVIVALGQSSYAASSLRVQSVAPSPSPTLAPVVPTATVTAPSSSAVSSPTMVSVATDVATAPTPTTRP